MNELKFSEELNLDDFRSIPRNVPFDVIYQPLTCSEFGNGGYSFNISSVGPGSLLSRDIWIEYNFAIVETAARFLENGYENQAALSADPASPIKFALRQGNVVARSTEFISLKLNDLELRYLPGEYIEVLNRLNVSTEQSKHEFSASGGMFSSGNHGYFTDNRYFYERGDTGVTGNNVNPFTFVGNSAAPEDQNVGNTHFYLYVIDGWYPDQQPDVINPAGRAVNPQRDYLTNLRCATPLKYEFYNPGFSDRVNKTALNLRWDGNSNVRYDVAEGAQFYSGSNLNRYTFRIMERLPIPLFKMYSNDLVHGVIPHIRDLKIHGQFYPNLLENMFEADQVPIHLQMDWTVQQQCRMYLKWYIVPQISVPPSVSFNCPIIDVHTISVTPRDLLLYMAANPTAKYMDTSLNYRDITLQCVPDVLMIYYHYQPQKYDTSDPSDLQVELVDMVINLNTSTAKLTGMQTMQYYQLWKNNLQYKNDDVMGYNEWRKYCFVAVLKPEDYGIKGQNEMNKPVNMSIRGTARNSWVNPSIFKCAPEVVAGTQWELVITSIYYRNSITIDRTYRTTKSIIPL